VGGIWDYGYTQIATADPTRADAIPAMTIRTTQELVDALADQLVWRRKELTELRSLADISRANASRQATLIRAGTALLYAHWEGFVKTSATYFLEYVSAQRRTHAELSTNFLCVILRKQLSTARLTKKVSATGDIIDFLLERMDSRANLPTKNVINTESNLSSLVFREILWTLGLDEAPYATKKTLLDEKLLARRNHIAHGQSLDVSVDDYLEMHDEILALMDAFKTQIENACILKQYLRSSASGRPPLA